MQADTMMDFSEGESRHHLDIKKKMMADHISRSTLGEIGNIGNRVSAITIDTAKGGAIKKEILQPTDMVLRNAINAKIKPNIFIKQQQAILSQPEIVPKQTITDTARVHVEWMPDHNLLQTRGIDKHEDIDANVFNHGVPMDDEDEGAFSKAMFGEVVEDIDSLDKDNPQLVSIYVNSIYNYMRALESKYGIKPNLLEGSELTGKMRAILIDWLCQVHTRFHLLQETLYMTVSIIDRYLQLKPCAKNRLQLVGVTSMLIASKYEEMFVPEVADFVYITDNAYTKSDVREMEQDILRTLDFSFGRPICLHFLRRNSKAGQVDATKHTLAKYLMELAMIEYDMAHVKPSLVAASALYLSMNVLDNSRWNETLKFYSSYSEVDLIPTAQKLAYLVVKTENSKQIAVRTKYSSSKFMKIATLPQLKSKVLLDMAHRKDSRLG